MTVAVLIVAAGRGIRAGGGALPKQYQPIGGVPMLARTIAAFAEHPGIGPIQVVIAPADRTLYDAATAQFAGRLLPPVAGGAARQGSVAAGIDALAPHAPELVLIHDAARPFVPPEVIDRVLTALSAHDGAIAALPVTDTLKRAGTAGEIAGTIERAGLWRAQTPQGFRFAAIRAAHARAAATGHQAFTDDAAIAEWAGLTVALVAGSEENVKVTTPEDLAAAERRLAVTAPALPDIRVGQGFDVHRFTGGDHVMLCGVRVPHSHGVEAHSDGDVALHALTDALLGAIGAGDIGQHFPPSDMRWKGVASSLFLAEAARLVAAAGGRISNIDVTVLCEKPRIGPYREAMRQAVAAVLQLEPARVNLKATTTEQLGFTGRGEGLAAMASATVIFPPRG